MIKIFIVIPTYNEKENIEKLLSAIESSLISYKDCYSILVVDDNSPDGTAEYVKMLQTARPYLILYQRLCKKGIGSAYLEAFEWILSKSDATHLIQMDADLQHPPSLLPKLIASSLQGCEVALGSRYISAGGIEDWPWYRRLISKIANMLCAKILAVSVKDATSGYRALSRRAAEILIHYKLDSRSYAYQVESLYILSKEGFRICEVPYVFGRRRSGKSKLTAKDVARFVVTILRLRLLGVKRKQLNVNSLY